MHASDVKTFFETTAAEWDTMRLTYYDERVIETIADAIAIDDTQTVLDVGTGSGFIAAGLAPRADRVIAIDNSPAMLDVARDHLAQLGIDNVEVREGDLTQPPLNDDSIDAAVANMVLHHAEDPTGMLAEMTQVVRPGGWVAITDCVEHPYEWMRTEQADIWLGLHARAGRGLLRLRATGPIRVRDPRIPVKHPVHDLGRGRHDRNLCCLGASPP
jgi:ubiquinone/menaquinone biosynthesis C-methylase UbiE